MVAQSQFIEMFGNPMVDEQKYPLKRLGDCCVINPKRSKVTISDSDPVSFVPMPSVSEEGYLQDVSDSEYGSVKKGFTYFENGDVLFAKITPCMENGKGAIAHDLTNGIGMGSTEFHVLRPIDGKSNSYWLFTLTKLPEFREKAAHNMSGTGGQQRVRADFLESFMIGLPPIELQNVLESICRQADKSKFDGLKSQFIEMFSGREYPQLPIRDFADITTGSTPSKSHPKYWGGSNPWVSAEDMKDKYVYDTVEKVTDKGYATCKHIPVNTLMYVCRGSIGVMAINKVECATNQSICTATCKADKCEVEFLYHSLLYKKDEIKQIGIGTNFKSLNQTTFSNLRIFLPPIEEQRRFVSVTTQADKSKYLS